MSHLSLVPEAATPQRFVSVSKVAYGSVGLTRHLLATGLDTACGKRMDDVAAWRTNMTKPRCLGCVFPGARLAGLLVGSPLGDVTSIRDIDEVEIGRFARKNDVYRIIGRHGEVVSGTYLRREAAIDAALVAWGVWEVRS